MKFKRKGAKSKGEKNLIKLIKTGKQQNDSNNYDETDDSINVAIWE